MILHYKNSVFKSMNITDIINGKVEKCRYESEIFSQSDVTDCVIFASSVFAWLDELSQATQQAF